MERGAVISTAIMVKAKCSSFIVCIVVPFIGAILGNPMQRSPGSFVVLDDISNDAILHAEAISTSAQKLAINLLSVLFTQEEISTGNCTKPNREDIKVLNPLKIQGIRGMYHQ